MSQKGEKKKQLRYPYVLTDALLCLALSAFILYPGLRGYSAVQQAKAEAFYIIFGLYLALMLLCTIELALMRQVSLPSAKAFWQDLSLMQKSVLLYWLVSAVSALASPYFPYTLLGVTRGEGLLTLTIYCMSFLCVSRFAKPKKWLCDLFAAVMIVFCAICLLQIAGRNPLSLYPDGTSYFGAGVDYAGEYLGPTGNADLTAAILAMAFPALSLAAYYGQGRARVLRGVSAALCLCVIALSSVRAGQLAALVTIAVVLPLTWVTEQKTRRTVRLLELLGLALVLIAIYFCGAQGGTIYEIKSLLHGNFDSDFGTGRIYIWREVLKLVPQHLLLGTGPDTMALASIQWGGQYQAASGGTINVMIDVAHNEYLNVLYHQGVLGLSAFLAIASAFARRFFRSDAPQTRICGAAVLAYLIQAFFGFSMCASAGVFWLMLALSDNGMEMERTK